jgi:hypothetical protein
MSRTIKRHSERVNYLRSIDALIGYRMRVRKEKVRFRDKKKTSQQYGVCRTSFTGFLKYLLLKSRKGPFLLLHFALPLNSLPGYHN